MIVTKFKGHSEAPVNDIRCTWKFADWVTHSLGKMVDMEFQYIPEVQENWYEFSCASGRH